DLRAGQRTGGRRRQSHRGDRGDPARDGPGVDVQVVPGHRAGRRRQLPGRAAGRSAAGARRAAGLALSDHAAVRGRGLRAAGARASRAPDRSARWPPDVMPRRPAVLTLLGVGLAALAVYPLLGTGYGVRAMLQLFMWVALAGSWNIISGLTGYVSFGHVALFGIGSGVAAGGLFCSGV